MITGISLTVFTIVVGYFLGKLFVNWIEKGFIEDEIEKRRRFRKLLKTLRNDNTRNS